MRSTIIALAAAIAVVTGVSLLSSHPAAAQETATKEVPIQIATLDVPSLFKESKAAKFLSAELKKRGKATGDEITKKEQALRGKREKLEQSRSALQPADYEAKLAALQKEFDALRKDASSKRKALDKMNSSGVQQIRKTLDVVIRDIADKRGLTLIIDRQAVVLGAEEWDITAEVLKGLDAKLPTVKLTN